MVLMTISAVPGINSGGQNEPGDINRKGFFYEYLIFNKPDLEIIQYVKSQTQSFRACGITSSSYRNRWN